jgi:hypothetical protein
MRASSPTRRNDPTRATYSKLKREAVSKRAHATRRGRREHKHVQPPQKWNGHGAGRCYRGRRRSSFGIRRSLSARPLVLVYMMVLEHR